MAALSPDVVTALAVRLINRVAGSVVAAFLGSRLFLGAASLFP